MGKRILVVSDTHGRDTGFYELMDTIGPVDLVIHCGDTEGSEGMMAEYCKCPFEAVLGNNDFFSFSPKERIIELENHRIMITHGNRYQVSSSMAWLLDAAYENECDIVCFGHTHVPYNKKERGILAINPGSLSYPRQSDRMPTYGILNLRDNGNAEFEIYRVK